MSRTEWEAADFWIMPIGEVTNDNRRVARLDLPTTHLSVDTMDGAEVGIITHYSVITGGWVLGHGRLDPAWFGAGVEAEVRQDDGEIADDGVYTMTGSLRRVVLGMNPAFPGSVVMPA